MPDHMLTKDQDAALVARAKTGDRDALSELYETYSGRGYNLALRMLGDPWDAADVLQEAFIKAFGALSGFKGDARFSTWFHRIVVNAVYDHMRRRRADPLEDEVMDRLAGPGGPAQLAGGIQASIEPHMDGLSDPLRDALMSLGEGFRLAVVLCDLLGFDHSEAAEILGVQEGTIKSRIFRARALLAANLRDRGYPVPEVATGEPRPHRARHMTGADEEGSAR